MTEPIWWYRHSVAHSAEPLRLEKQTLCQLSYSRSGECQFSDRQLGRKAFERFGRWEQRTCVGRSADAARPSDLERRGCVPSLRGRVPRLGNSGLAVNGSGHRVIVASLE
jgi:hypothetical protein